MTLIPPPISTAKRFTEIDGIRGWASLCVLLFHLSYGLFGVQFPELRNPVTLALLDGNLAVFIFFILSGDALSIGFTSNASKGISAKMILKRYFRLTGPILFSCSLVFILMKSGLMFHREAFLLIDRHDFSESFLPFDPSFVKMLKYSLIGCYTEHSTATTYNPFLWTMSIEFCGSLVVFCLGFLADKLRSPLTVAACCAVFLFGFGSYYALFFIGVCFGYLRARGLFAGLQAHGLNRVVMLGGVLMLLLINAFKANIPILPPYQKDILIAASGVWLCYASPDLLAIMRSKLSLFLGRISFPLYFMQFPIIISYTGFAILYGKQHFNDTEMLVFVITTSLVLVVVVATLTEMLEIRYLKRVDEWVQKLLK